MAAQEDHGHPPQPALDEGELLPGEVGGDGGQGGDGEERDEGEAQYSRHEETFSLPCHLLCAEDLDSGPVDGLHLRSPALPLHHVDRHLHRVPVDQAVVLRGQVGHRQTSLNITIVTYLSSKTQLKGREGSAIILPWQSLFLGPSDLEKFSIICLVKLIASFPYLYCNV